MAHIAAPPVYAPYLAEFLCSFIVAFARAFYEVAGEAEWRPTAAAFATATTMYASAAVSGGYVNPALSLAFGMAGRLRCRTALGYCCVQVAGALVAALLAASLLGPGPAVGSTGTAIDTTMSVKLILEAVFTAVLCFVGLSCMQDGTMQEGAPVASQRSQCFGIALGFVYVAGGHAAAGASGAFFSPATALACGLTGPAAGRLPSLLYVASEAVGATVAVVFYLATRPGELHLPALPDGLRALSLCLLSCCGRWVGVGSTVASVAGAGRAGRDAERGEAAAAPDTRGALGEASSSPALHLAEVEHGGSNGHDVALSSKVLSEFLGTYVLALTAGLTLMAAASGEKPTTTTTTGAPTASSQVAETRQGFTPTYAAWASGAGMLSMACAVGDVSGAHFNPAVTLAAVLSGRCPMHEGFVYMLTQAVAGLVASVTLVAMHPYGDLLADDGSSLLPDLGPLPGFGEAAAGAAECIFTIAVALVLLSVTSAKSARYPKATSPQSFNFGLALGLCVAAGGFAAESISGGVLNPALALGMSTTGLLRANAPSAWLRDLSWRHVAPSLVQRGRPLILFVLSELGGGALAAVIFAMTHPLLYKRDPLLVGRL